MKTETKEIYKCDYCNKLYQIKKYAINHEPRCKKNPANKQRCLEGCTWLIEKEVKYLWENTYVSEVIKKDILFCEKKNKYVYPFWVNNPILQEDIIGEIANDIMPSECKSFSTEY